MTDPITDLITDPPQPLGAFGFPAGFLLIDASSEGSSPVAAARAELLAGRRPVTWPDELRALELTHADDLDGALAYYAGVTAADPTGFFNRWVIDPHSASVDEVRAALPPELAPLVDVVGYTTGHSGPPSADVTGVAAEVAALVLATRATLLLEQGDRIEAARGLAAGSDLAGGSSPALAAVLLGNAGTLLAETGDPALADQAEEFLAAACAALSGTDLGDVHAALLSQRGSLAHEAAASGRGDEIDLLKAAMQHYYDALHLVTETSDPLLWAGLQMNLAIAHLASPMTMASDQLRLGIATQALRACRRVYTPQEHPGPWSTATLNLANALIYTPSTHQGDNLVEAVELYELVLESGIRGQDPLGRARLLSNQGNALAHLGMFDVARGKLVEARYVFEEQMDHDSAGAVRSLLDELAKAEAANAAEHRADPMQELARQAEQMGRMPQTDAAFTSGIGLQPNADRGSLAGDQAQPPRKPTVTRLPATPAGSDPR
ncbi:hypothetical protein GCM10027020_28050 [Nocardioides salsibiostraticola]